MRPAQRLPGWQQAAGYGLLLAAAVIAAVVAGYPAMFSAFTSADEGGFLLYIEQTLAGMPLYDVVFTQYGPAYFVVMDAVFSLPSITVSHDAGRMITLGLWTATSLTCGATLLRLTSYLVVALSGLVVVFYALSAMVYEPMHVGGTIAILLAGILATAAFLLPGRPRSALFVIGALAVTAALVKINVGLFALAAIAFACAVAMSPVGNPRPIRFAAAAVVAVLPFALMLDSLSEGWVRSYALEVALGALAVAAAAFPLPGGWPRRPLPWLVAGGAAAGVLVLAVVTIQGTTPGGLVEGIITRPLRHADLFLTEIDLLRLAPLWPLLGLAAALAVTRSASLAARARDSAGWLAPLLRVAAGIGLWYAVTRTGGAVPADSAFLHDYNADWIAVVASLAWVAAIPTREDRADPTRTFMRCLVPMLAVLQLLHAYPIPGTQVAWGLFPAAVAGGVCVSDGLRDLRPYLEGWGIRPIGNVALALLAALFVALPFADWTTTVRDAYAAERSLGLPGAHRLRLPEQQAEELRALTAEIHRSCSSFVTLPGIESLYLFTEMDAPTSRNGAPWPVLIDDEEQAEMVEQVEDLPRLCAVRNQSAADFLLSLGPGYAQRPMVRFIQEEFTTTDTFGPFELMQRK